jgi:hypothetical protein
MVRGSGKKTILREIVPLFLMCRVETAVPGEKSRPEKYHHPSI